MKTDIRSYTNSTPGIMNKSLLQSLDQDYIVNEVLKDQPNGGRQGEPAIIKVIGVGGGGSNAVNYMFEKKLQMLNLQFAIQTGSHSPKVRFQLKYSLVLP